jgi:outer membrane protein assembly factor BamD (BamD/ComL family)
MQEALQSGNLSGAETAYNNLDSLANTVLHQNNPFVRSDRAADFSAIGGELQSGDLSAAQQALAELESTFKLRPSAESSSAAATPESGVKHNRLTAASGDCSWLQIPSAFHRGA